MKARSLLSVLLAVVMLLSLAAFTPAAFAEISADDASAQLSLIFSGMNDCKQDGTTTSWYYAVTDLDHDDRLELVAASQHPVDRSTNLKVWEVNEARDALVECSLKLEEEESFPDILTDNVDTYHDTESDTWFYMFYDNIVLSDQEVYTLKCAVSMVDDVLSYEPFAIEHTELVNGVRRVSHMDNNGFAISPEQYNASGANAFAQAERSSTSFEWFAFEDASVARLTDSYLVFLGQKAPTENFPVPKPSALQDPTASVQPQPTLTPVPTPVPQVKPAYLMITKNPTNENRKAGDTALFVSCANIFDTLSWTLVSPNGGEYSVQNFRNSFPSASVTGEYSTTLSIAKTDVGMQGWGAYCTFYYNGQTARTSTAYMYISSAPAPTPTPTPPPESGSFNGTVTDYTYNTITLYINDGGGYTKDVSRDICSITGELYIGAPCVAYYNGIGAQGAIFTYVTINGSVPTPQPAYGSMSGTAYHDTAFTVFLRLMDGTELHVDGLLCQVINGGFSDGAPCTAYYTDYPSESNIYLVEIYGEEPPAPAPAPPQSGSFTGSVSDFYGDIVTLYINDGGGYTRDVGRDICVISGELYVGAPCVAYYDGIGAHGAIFTRVEITGSEPQPEPEPEPEPDPVPIYLNPSGTYAADRITMTISGSRGWYDVHVTWGSGATSSAEWNLTGDFDANNGMYYTGTKTITEYDGEGNVVSQISESVSGTIDYYPAGSEYVIWSEAPGTQLGRIG